MTVKVGVGVIIVNAAGQILLGKRCGSHAPYWSIPGGHVEQGETFEQTAIREVAEECGLHIDAPRFVGVTNNLRTRMTKGYTMSLSLCRSAHQRRRPLNAASRRNANAGNGAIHISCRSLALTPVSRVFSCGLPDRPIVLHQPSSAAVWSNPHRSSAHTQLNKNKAI